RNQEMLLSFLTHLKNLPDSEFHQLPFVMIAAAFDGIEGNSPAMGAMVDSSSLLRTKKLDLDLVSYLENNDSYTCFSKLGDALITGPTKTNVNDLFLILIGTTEMVF
ncbi:MAG: MOFRL family protein, partial [Promethearchaeota archaeon]